MGNQNIDSAKLANIEIKNGMTYKSESEVKSLDWTSKQINDYFNTHLNNK